MRALSLSGPRKFEFVEIPDPSPPGPNDALVAVRAIGVCGTDLSGYLGKMPFIQYPRILGHELGVEVLALGSSITHLEVGAHCSVEPYLNCGTCHSCSIGKTNCCEVLQVLGVHRDGGMTQKLLLPAHKLHSARSLTFSQLAIVETLAIGCHAVDRAAISAKSSVLIIGAGPIGLSVLEFARLKTNHVAVVERDDKRREFIQRHYSEVTVFDVTTPLPNFEVVFDATGNANCMADSINHAQFGGRIVYVGITSEPIPLNDALFHRRELSLLASRNACSSDFPKIIGLIESGRIDTSPWISCTCNFDAAPALFADLVDGRIKDVKAIIEAPFS